MKNILIWDVPNHPWMTIEFVRRLKKDGINIHLIYNNEESYKYWQGARDIISSFSTLKDIASVEHDFPIDPDPAVEKGICAAARWHERRYGLYLVDALQADRHLGKGFFSGGIRHPRSLLSERFSYIKSARFFNRVIIFWEWYFDKYKIDAVMGFPGNFMSKTLAAVARKKFIPFRILVWAKHKNLYLWAKDEHFSCPQVMAAYKETTELFKFVNVYNPNVVKAYEEFAKIGTLKEVFRRISVKTAQHVSKKIKGLRSFGNYLWREEVKYVLSAHTEYKKIMKLSIKNMVEITTFPYILIPLNTEPETSLGLLSPEFNEQLAMVELLAKNLPAGVKIVVKEHLIAIGRRPRDFYETIARIPNAILADPGIRAYDLLDKALCVAVISGTIGAEAAIKGIPVISFGLHNNFDFLSYVHIVTNIHDIRDTIAQIYEHSTDEDRAKARIIDGMRYLAALEKTALNTKDYYSDKNRKALSPEDIEVFYKSFTESLN